MSIKLFLRKSLALFATALALSATAVSQENPSLAPLSKRQIFQKLDPQMAEVVLLFDAIKGTPIIDLHVTIV